MLALTYIITITYDCTRYKELVGGMLTDIIGFLWEYSDSSCFQDNFS